MHDTSFRVGDLFFGAYGAREKMLDVLELGAMNVNGGLKALAPAHWRYFGVDLEPGPGVDLVVAGGQSLPFKDSSFDLVLASSVFEHDPCFWESFAELARVCRPGGFIYVNAPSNGAFHRFPADHWRFYPEAGLALAQWAGRRGSPVLLLESFIANRLNDDWNDFVAVFQVGEIATPPSTFLHELVGCCNVLRYGSAEIISETATTEDMSLLAKLRAELVAARRTIEEQDRILRERDARHGAIADLMAPPRGLATHLDIIRPDVVFGWAIDANAPEARISILVTANGVSVAGGRACEERSDLVALGGGATDYAFAMPIVPPAAGLVQVWAVGPWGRREIGSQSFLI